MGWFGVVRDQGSLSAMSPFDRAHTTSYSYLIETIVYLVPFMRYSLRWVQNRSILIPLLRLRLPTEGFPWNDLRKILHGSQRMASVYGGEEKLPRASTPWVGCTNVTDRQTDRWQTDR